MNNELKPTEKEVPVNTPSKTMAITLRLYEEVETSAILWVYYLSSPANKLAKHFTHFVFVQFSIHTGNTSFLGGYSQRLITLKSLHYAEMQRKAPSTGLRACLFSNRKRTDGETTYAIEVLPHTKLRDKDSAFYIAQQKN